MKNLIIAIFCISIIIPSYSQTENADATYLKIIKEYTLNEDGSIEYNYYKQIKLQTHFAFHRLYGETFIIYNTDFQELEINSAYTIMADGKKIVTPDNAFNKVLPRFSNKAPAFNNLREMVVTHTGLEKDAIINLDYSIKTHKDFFPTLMGDEILETSSPVKEFIIIVNIPESKTLNYELFNITGQPNIVTKESNKSYTWTFNSIPASSKDYYQVSDHEYAPRLVFSTANDLKFVFDKFINQNAFVYNANESMNDAVVAITKENSDKLEVALELQKLVVNNLNNLNIPLMYTGFKCRNATDIWNSNQGTKLEKAILLTTLLQNANINAEPVVIIPDMYYNTKIGNLLSFNDFLVKIKIKKLGDIYLSPVHIDNHNLIFGLSDKKILLLDKNIESLKLYSHKSTINNILVKGEFDFQTTDKLLGKITLDLQGKSNPYFNLLNDSSNINSIIVGGISSKDFVLTKIQKLTQQKSLSQLEFEKNDPFEQHGNYMIFNLPTTSNGVDSWHLNLLPAKRDVQLEIPYPIHEKYEYAIVFPADFKLVSNPTFKSIKNNAGQVTIIFEKSGNELIIKKEIILNKKVIGTEVYNDFKVIMDIWNNKNLNKVIFKK